MLGGRGGGGVVCTCTVNFMCNPTTVVRLYCDVVAVVTTATTYDFEIGVIDKIYKS